VRVTCLSSDSLRAKARSREVWLVPGRAIGAATVGAVLVPRRRVVLRLVSGWAVVGRLLVVVLRVGWLRQGREAEHGATRVTFSGSPGSGRTIVLRRGGAGGGCRGGRPGHEGFQITTEGWWRKWLLPKDHFTS